MALLNEPGQSETGRLVSPQETMAAVRGEGAMCVGGVTQQLGDLGEAINWLHRSLAGLEERLGGVLTQRVELASEDIESTDSQYAAIVRDHYVRVRDAARFVEHLAANVDL